MTPNTTATATFNATGKNETIYNSSATLLTALTINLPSTTVAGQMLRYVCKGAVTVLTVNGTIVAGSTVSSLLAGSVLAFQSVNTTGSFARIQ